MKKGIISLLLVALMMLSLAACKNKSEEANTEPLPPGLMLVPEDYDAEFDPWVDETVTATEAVKEDEITAATEETKADKEASETEDTEAEKETSATEDPASPTESEPPEETREAAGEETEPTEPAVPAPTIPETKQYEWYQAMTGEQQVAFAKTFDSLADFFDWYNAAKEAYEKENPGVEIGDGNIDLGEIAGGNG